MPLPDGSASKGEERMSHSTNRAESPPTEPLLAVKGLRKQYEASAFSSAGKEVLRGVDFQVQPTETVGIVGLSGAGKSTIGRLVAGLERPDGERSFIPASPSAGCAAPDGARRPAGSR